MEKIRGKVIILGDDVDTDQILPGYAMSEPYEEIGKYAMAGLPTEDFKLNREPGCILVAGRNFGCGSSREQAPIALKQAQVALVVAQGFARIFRRNCINIGMPVFVADAVKKLHTGEIIEVRSRKRHDHRALRRHRGQPSFGERAQNARIRRTDSPCTRRARHHRINRFERIK